MELKIQFNFLLEFYRYNCCYLEFILCLGTFVKRSLTAGPLLKIKKLPRQLFQRISVVYIHDFHFPHFVILWKKYLVRLALVGNFLYLQYKSDHKIAKTFKTREDIYFLIHLLINSTTAFVMYGCSGKLHWECDLCNEINIKVEIVMHITFLIFREFSLVKIDQHIWIMQVLDGLLVMKLPMGLMIKEGSLMQMVILIN